VDWQALKGVAKAKILELASCQFITNAESVSVAGPIGTGKTMLAITRGDSYRGHKRKTADDAGAPPSNDQPNYRAAAAKTGGGKKED